MSYRGYPFKVRRCARCGAFAKPEDLTEPNIMMGTGSVHKAGPRGGDRCKAIIRKRAWFKKLHDRKRKEDRELMTLLGIA